MAIKEENVDKYYKDEDKELYDKSLNKIILSNQQKKRTTRSIPYGDVEFLHDVPLQVIARFGKSSMKIKQLLGLKEGSTCVFDKTVGEPIDIVIGGKIMARGEIVIVNERYGVRISEINRPE